MSEERCFWSNHMRLRSKGGWKHRISRFKQELKVHGAKSAVKAQGLDSQRIRFPFVSVSDGITDSPVSAKTLSLNVFWPSG